MKHRLTSYLKLKIREKSAHQKKINVYDIKTNEKYEAIIFIGNKNHEGMEMQNNDYLPIEKYLKICRQGAYEINEEFGMSVRIGDPFAVFDYVNDIKGSHSVEIIYFGEFIDPIEQIKLNDEDHSEFIWFDGSDYEQILIGDKDDREITVIKKGFALLNGESLAF